MQAAVRAHGQPGADGVDELIRAGGEQNHLLGVAGFFDAQRLLDRDFAERIHRHLDIVGLDAAVVGLDPHADVGVDNALDGDQNFHRPRGLLMGCG